MGVIPQADAERWLGHYDVTTVHFVGQPVGMHRMKRGDHWIQQRRVAGD